MEMNEEIYGERTSYVIVDGEYVKVSDTTFLNISEDIYGRDVYEFEYNGKQYSSNVILK